jgi:copper chaperone CopZ
MAVTVSGVTGSSTVTAKNNLGQLSRIDPETIVMPVLGMTCAACQHHVEDALRAAPGVVSARVDLMRHRASIEFDPHTTQPSELVSAIRE